VFLGPTSPNYWILAALLVVAWLLSRWAPSRYRRWFLPGAVLAVITCFLLSVVVLVLTSGPPCQPGDPFGACYDIGGVDWFINGLVGAETCVVLAVLTGLSWGARRLARRSDGDARKDRG
jgi:hypothetical protein